MLQSQKTKCTPRKDGKESPVIASRAFVVKAMALFNTLSLRAKSSNRLSLNQSLRGRDSVLYVRGNLIYSILSLRGRDLVVFGHCNRSIFASSGHCESVVSVLTAAAISHHSVIASPCLCRIRTWQSHLRFFFEVFLGKVSEGAITPF